MRTTEPLAVKQILEQARDLLGTSYCNAGTTPDCFDCSGFVGYCFRVVGVKLPRISSDIYSVGNAVSRSEVQEGDLVFFANEQGVINHVGIALNEKQFIHSSTSKGVSIAMFSDRYWSPRYKGARRIALNASK